MAGDARAEHGAPLLLPPFALSLRRHRGPTRTALFLASKDIFKDWKVAALVVCVLAFSFLNLVFFTSFQYGLQNSFEDSLVGSFTSHVIIEPKEGLEHVEDVGRIEDKLNLIPGVTGIAANLEDAGIQVRFHGRSAGARLVGVTPSRFATVSSIPSRVVDGEFLTDGDSDQAVLGIEISGIPEGHETQKGHYFGYGVEAWTGDRVTLHFSNGESRQYRVKGVVRTGGFAADFNVYLTRKEMESIFPETQNKAREILVSLTDRHLAREYRDLFMAEGVREEIKTWEDQAGFIRDIGASVSVIAGVTGAVGIVTVAVTMAIVIYINTSHKRRLMGVLKAIGATDGVVFQLFIFESVLFGLLGIVVGVGLSQAMAGAFARNPIPVPIGGGVVPDVRPELLAQGAAAVLGAGLLAAYYPAWRAARHPIVQSIWG